MVSVPRWGGKQPCMGSTWWAGGCTSRWACRARSTSTTSLLFSSRRLEGSRDAESHAGTILGNAHTHHHSQQHSQDPQPQQNPPHTHTSACPGSATGCAGYPYPQLGMQHSPLPGHSPIGCHLARCCLMGWGHLRAFQLHKHPLVLRAGGEPWHNGSPRGGEDREHSLEPQLVLERPAQMLLQTQGHLGGRIRILCSTGRERRSRTWGGHCRAAAMAEAHSAVARGSQRLPQWFPSHSPERHSGGREHTPCGLRIRD